MLSGVAREKLFSAQATRAQNERDFSQAGLTRTARRAQVSAKKLMLNFELRFNKMGF